MYLPQCSEEDKRAAACHKVHLIEAEEMPGYDPVDWLATIPKGHVMDCVIGHGVHLGRQVPLIKRLHGNCKWVQLVHTDPEERGMFKSCANPISKGEKKHQAEVQLCELADQVVAVGSKLAEAFAAYLRSNEKDQDVLNLTPGIFTEFKNVRQAPEERKTFRVLVFGCEDSEDFQLKGYDIAGKAIAELKDMPQDYKLVFVGAPVGEEEKITKLLLKEGIARSQLTVRHFDESREHLAKLFCEVDLAIMPSRSEGFGLAALEALSAGLPVLVSGNSGLGDALKKVLHGSNCVVNSDDPKRWAEAIQAVCDKDRGVRLGETKDLRGNYAEKYSWEEQCGRLVQKMMDITFNSSEIHVSRKSKRLLSPRGTPAPKQFKVLTSGPEGSSKAQASETGKRPSSSSDASSPKKRKILTGDSEGADISPFVASLKNLYKQRSELRPQIAGSHIKLDLEKVYTRLKIILRPKGFVPLQSNEMDVYGILEAHNKGEDIMALAEGSPGIGKTTLCLKMANDWVVEDVAASTAFSNFEFVLLLKCRDIDGDIMEAISEQLLPEDFNEEMRKTVLEFIKDVSNQKRILIILDGLDELPQNSKHHVEKLLARKILPCCSVFATCRQERGIEVRKDFKFDFLLKIEGFTERDACEYIRKHFKYFGPDLSSKGEKLIEEIKENTFLHALQNNPLNLLLLCVIYEDYEGKLPSSRTKLYQEIVQCLLRRYCAKHNMEAPEQDRDLEKQFKKDILALGELAWKCLLQDRHSFREDELKEMEKRNENLVARGLGLLYKEESLKRLKPQHEYYFLHKTFQEYLAACYIARKLRRKKFSVFEDLSFDDLVRKYRQVFLFVSGLLGEEASLLFEQIGKELEGHWSWKHCDGVSAAFFIDSFTESENGEQIVTTLCSFIPFPLDAHLQLWEERTYNFIGVLGACKRFSNLQTPVNLSCAVAGDKSAKLDVFAVVNSCPELKTLSIKCERIAVEELARNLPHSFAASTSLSQLTLEVFDNISSDIAAMIGNGLTKSKSLKQVGLKFPGICGSGWLSVLETGLTADSPLTAAVLTVYGPMNETAIQALEKVLLNESLTSLSFTLRGDMQDLLATALSRGLTRQISIRSLDLCVEGKLGYHGAKLLERGLLENHSLNYVEVFVRGELPKNWKAVVENVRLAKKSQAFFHSNIFSQVTTNQVLPFRPFAVKGEFCPNQHLTVNICGELTVEGADALCEVLCPSLSRLTVNLYGKVTDGVSHLSTRCIGLKKSLSSVTVNIWGTLTEEEKTLSHDIKDKNSAITLNVHDVPILQDDSSNDVNVSIGDPASLGTLLTEVKNTSKEKHSLSLNSREDALVDWLDVLGEESTLKELTLTVNDDTFERQKWSIGGWFCGLGDCLKHNTSIRELTLTVYGHGFSNGQWGMGLGDGLMHNTSIRKLTLIVHSYGYSSKEWGMGLGDGLMHNTSIRKLTLTVHSYGYSEEEWGMAVGNGLMCNTSIRELTLTVNSFGVGGFEFTVHFFRTFCYNRSVRALSLTINNYCDLSGFGLECLGEGLARSTSLTSCNLVFNMHGKVEDDYLPKLCENLMRSESLTTLTLQVNDPHLSNGSRDYDLSKVLVKSRSLSSIDLTVSFYGTETNTSDTSDAAE